MRTSSLFALVALVALSVFGGCTDPRADLRALAKASSCEIDSDCCIAVDGCSATAYPMDRTQVDAAVAAVDDAKDGACVDCIAPRGIPRCDDGRCALIALDFEEEGPDLDNVGVGVSCLAVAADPVTTETTARQALGCGAVDDE